jgi:hypothetical protein
LPPRAVTTSSTVLIMTDSTVLIMTVGHTT